MSLKPKGIIPAMITPLTRDGKVNEAALRKLVRYLINGGVHGIFAAGTSGEFYGLTKEQHKEVLQITMDEVKGRIPIYAGAAAITTKQVVELINIAEDVGVDAVSVLTPWFISLNQDELYHHYLTIAKHTKLPVILYNNPLKTGVNITSVTASRLADIENIVAIKDSSGDLTLTAEYIRTSQGKGFNTLSGRDTLIYSTLCLGGTGAISSCANVAPNICAKIYNKFIIEDTNKSREAQYQIAPLRIAFSLGSFPVVIKEALNLIGIEAGPCIEPVGKLDSEAKEQLRKILIDMKLI